LSPLLSRCCSWNRSPSAGNHDESSSTCLYEQALHLPADNFFLQRLASRPERPRLKKRPSWRSFCSSQENQALRENLILCPSIPPLDPPPQNFTVTSLIEDCSRSDRGRSNATADFLSSLPTSDVVVWTDGSIPSPLDAGGAGIQQACRRCSSSSSLSYSACPISFS